MRYRPLPRHQDRTFCFAHRLAGQLMGFIEPGGRPFMPA
jgi:hypothetical protein